MQQDYTKPEMSQNAVSPSAIIQTPTMISFLRLLSTWGAARGSRAVALRGPSSSSNIIIRSLVAAGIPVNPLLSRDNLLLLAYNTLSSPPPAEDDPLSTPELTTQTKQAGRKRTAKSSSPHPAKRSTAAARPASPIIIPKPNDANDQLIQVVQGLTNTVKGLEKKRWI